MKFLFLTGILFLTTVSFAETKYTTRQYIDQWKATAVDQMLKHRIPASITLAQGILESANGNSRLAREAKNHFGIKCHTAWTGDTFIQDDDKKDECFRSYRSAHESYNDHSIFLTGRKRYARLFNLRLQDYKGWAKGLKACGYATNPKYAYLLIDIIEKYDLDQYDKLTKPLKKEPELSVKKKAPEVIVEKRPVRQHQHRKTIEKSTPEIIKINAKKHKIRENKNRVNYVIVDDGDTFYRIAKEFDMTIGQLYKYNEFAKKDVLEKGDIIYVAPKRSKALRGNEKYICKENITIRQIAHEEGIKLSSLLRLNLMENPDEYLRKGTKVTLR